jgi:hypothetical protein
MSDRAERHGLDNLWGRRRMSPIPRANEGGAIARDAAEWFRHRSYDYHQFSNLEEMGARKRELGLTVSVILPCRNVADTVGTIIDGSTP